MSLTSCLPLAKNQESHPPGTLRIILDAIPLTLNPRQSLDASGQRLGSLLFRALTRLDAELKVKPDLAQAWSVSADGKRWVFEIAPGLVDQAGQEINAARLAACLQEYAKGQPVSALQAAFPAWKSAQVDPKNPSSLLIELGEPDPYLLQNLSLLRYFSVVEKSDPCAEPEGKAVIGSGDYRLDPWQVAPQSEALLVRVDSSRSELAPALHFTFVRDDNTRALRLIRGDVDAILNGLSLSKTHWVKESYSDRFDVLERPGVNVSYLAFDFRNPLLQKVEVRRALSHAIDRRAIVEHKMFGMGRVAGSFLSPGLEGAADVPVDFAPERAEALLDKVGLRRGADGFRFRLRYGTTPVREGTETALLVQQMLGKIGVRVDIEVVEPAVFFAVIPKGRFDLYSSRWVGVSDGSIFYRTLRTGQPRNRTGYSDAEMDRLLDELAKTLDPMQRNRLLRSVQQRLVEQAVYLPLWFWSNALVVKKDALVPEISLSGALDPLARIRLLR